MLWQRGTGSKTLNLSQVFVLFLTSDLSVEGANKRRIFVQVLIEYHHFMNPWQISLTETSAEECFHVGCCSRKSVPPVVCEVLDAQARMYPCEILSQSTYTSPQEATDQHEIQTCLVNVIRFSEHSRQGNTRFAHSSFPLLHVTEQIALSK